LGLRSEKNVKNVGEFVVGEEVGLFGYLFNGNGATAPFPKGYHSSRSFSKFLDESDFIEHDIIWQRLQGVVKEGLKSKQQDF